MSPAKKALPRLESDLSDERGAEEKQSSGLLSQFGIVYGVLKKEKFVTLIGKFKQIQACEEPHQQTWQDLCHAEAKKETVMNQMPKCKSRRRMEFYPFSAWPIGKVFPST